MSPQRTSPPMKNCFKRLSTLRVRHMPFKISTRSVLVSDAAMASRCRKASQASTSSARACSSRFTAVVRGVVSGSPSGAVSAMYSRRASSRLNGVRSASRPLASRGFSFAPPVASNTSRASSRARGWRSVTNAAKRAAKPDILVRSAVRGITAIIGARCKVQGARVQGCTGAGVQGCKGAKVRGCEGAKVRRCEGAKVRGMVRPCASSPVPWP